MDSSSNFIPFIQVEQIAPVPVMETSIGCVINGIQQLTVNENSDITKKRVRRKPRQKKPDANMNLPGSSTTELEDDSMKLDNFKITAVSSQSRGKVFRIKKLGCRHIHNSYFSNDTAGGHQLTSNTHDELHYKIKNDKPVVTNQNGIINNNTPSHLDRSNLQSSPNVSSGSSKNSAKKKKKSRLYAAYWPEKDVENGLANGTLVTGFLRINKNNHNEGYVTAREQSQLDFLLPTVVDRNRALEGDFVAVAVKPQEEWTEKQKTATVVSIVERVHCRTAVGYLLPLSVKKKSFATFIPRDKRIPRIKIPLSSCPGGFRSQNNSAEILYKAKITSWQDIDYAQGIITELLGINGDLDSELIAIIAEHNINIEKCPKEFVNHNLNSDSIPSHEYSTRLDLTKECIFTIDPLTARDLDDAVSCKQLPDGNVEVGVHISDVGFHVLEGTPLDRIVSKKATSTYFVNNVFHMLPEELCRKCSLLPGLDKRAFSVIWVLTPTGEIVQQRFSRTVINSCTQLSYEHAQMMIDEPNRTFETDELPPIHGGFTYRTISEIVNILNGIAIELRKKRFEKGALRIDQTKLIFRLDGETNEPLSFFTYENKESHRLIEEFMLLANISVAQKISEDFPSLAFLRCHDSPKEAMLVEMKKNLNVYGYDIDISSSKALQTSILALNDKLGVPQMAALNHLLAKPMNRARYFCAETQNDFSHYALHVPIYTHFTSPIRRYADIMVHRLLASSLGYTIKPKWSVSMVAAIAENCNRQKYSAKLAGEASSDLFLAYYVEKHQPFVKTAVVFQVRSHSFDVLVHATGSIIRVNEKSFDKGVWRYQENENIIHLIFPETSEYCKEIIKIGMFQTVTINLTRKPNSSKLEAQLLRPISSTLFQNTSALNA